MKNTLVLWLLLVFLFPLGAATWTGSISTSWSNASNWNPVAVPTSTTDVTIPNVTIKPVINAAANCRNLTIQTGSSVTLNSTYNLTVSGTMSVNGALNMSGTGDLYVTGSFFWEAGSTASITNSGAAIYASWNMQFHASSNVQMANGTIHFTGSLASSDLANYSALTQINALNIAKSAGTSFSIRSLGQPFTINSHINNQEGNTFYNYFTGDITLKGNIIDLNTDPAYGIKWDNGTLIMDGTGPSIGLRSTSCYLKNLTFSQTGTSQLTWPLTLKGKLRIESGVFYPQAHNITLAGDWENLVGPAAFTEGTVARVTFNGTSHQYVNYSETFNILEVNSGAALRLNSSTAVVTCVQYDWTAGGIDVVAGTFTANDLAESGIFGSYWVTPTGTINLTNNDSWVDLNGSMTFTNGGTINVYGGTGTSDWSYGGNASLTMNGGGILDFKNVGINIYNSPTYSLTYSINNINAEIRTVGSFTCNRSTFNPTSGSVVMYGGTDATLTMNAGCLNDLRVNKATTREEETTPQPTFITDERSGTSREVTRANTVSLATNVTCGGTLWIDYGTLNLQSYQLSCFRAQIYTTLKMNNAGAKLFATNQIIWNPGSIADITLGTLETTGAWDAWGSANVVLPVAVNTLLTGTGSHNITITTANMQFGNLVVGSASAGTGYTISSSSTQDLFVAGALTITASNELDLNTRNMTVNGALNLNGKLDIHATTATVHGKPYLETTSNLTIDSGGFYCDESAVLPRTTYLKGILSINSGTFNLVNNSLTVNAGSTNTLTSGTIYCDGINAQNAGTFQPAGGTIVLGNLFGGGTYGLRVSNGNWLPNVTIDAGTQGYFLYADLIIKGNLTLLSGGFDVQNTPTVYTVTIGGNWSHQGGTFYPRTGRVIFNGTGYQYVNYSETFNIVEVNKTGGALRVNGSIPVVTIGSYDWTAGSVDVLGGILNILDLVDNGMYGGFYCTTGGFLNVTQDSAQSISLYGTIHVTGGIFNIYGGSADASWARYSASTVTVTDGSLIYNNQGIQIRNTYALTYNISGGTITTSGQIYCNRTDFIPAGGTFRMIGSTDTILDFQSAPGSSLYNLTISKSSVSNRVSQSATEQTIRGDLDISSGTYYMTNRTLNCLGNLTVWWDGKLYCYNSNTIKLAANKSITVAGGYIDVVGFSNDTRTTFTRYSEGSYGFVVQSGGTLAANYVLFEYLNSQGVYITAGGTIDGLHNSTFQNGVAGAPLLNIANTQTLNLTYANFPTNAGGGAKNVYKPNNSGSLNFAYYSGVFGGPVYEYDPNNLVFWTGNNANLSIASVNWIRPDNYVCALMSAQVTVQNTGINDIITPFRVDLYKNQPVAPAAGSLGDLYQTISSLEAGASRIVTFTNLSTDIASTWTSWLRLDTNNLIPESDEGNNLSSAYPLPWLALPDISDISAERVGTSTVMLSWTYPITVNRYIMYRSTDPYFTPGAGTYYGITTGTTAYIGTLSHTKYFYRITAQRDLP